MVAIGADPTPGGSGLADGLVVEHLVKRYGSPGAAHPALDDVSLRVDRGRFLAIVGPSGSGKSTLLRIAAGLIRADSGSVTIFGE